MKTQCPSCKSYNESRASFCDQCGTPLSGLVARRASRPQGDRARRDRVARGLTITLGVLLLASLAGLSFLDFPPPEERREEVETSEPVQISRLDSRPIDGEASREETSRSVSRSEDRSATIEEEVPLHRLKPITQRAMVTVTPFDEFDQRMDPTTGVLLGEDGALVLRLEPLIGATRAECRVWGRRRPYSLDGFIRHESLRNLALVRISPRADVVDPDDLAPLPGLATLEPVDLLATLESPDAEVLVVAPEDASSGRDWIRTRVAESAYFSQDRIPRIRLEAGLEVRGEPKAVVDAFGYLIGLGKVEVSPFNPAEARLLVDSVSELALESDQPVTATFSQVNALYYENTFAAFSKRGAYRAAQGDFSRAVQQLLDAMEIAERELVDDEAYENARRTLIDSLRGLSAKLIRERSWRRLERVLERAVVFLPRERDLWIALAVSRRELNEHGAFLQAALQARQLQDGEEIVRLLQQAYLGLKSQLLEAGDANAAAQALLEGIDELPRSGPLHFELGKMYFSWEYWQDAERFLRAARELDPSLAGDVDLYLERIADALRQRDGVIVEFDDPKRMFAPIVVDGAARYTFQIDTGANMSTITESMARQLGYGRGDMTRMVRGRSATGEFRAPILRLDSMSLEGFTVRDIDVIVLPDGSPTLLGTDFLSQFRYSVDPARGEFRLEPR